MSKEIMYSKSFKDISDVFIINGMTVKDRGGKYSVNSHCGFTQEDKLFSLGIVGLQNEDNKIHFFVQNEEKELIIKNHVQRLINQGVDLKGKIIISLPLS